MKVSIIGLGYVGLPIAVHAAKAGYSVGGFDVNIMVPDEAVYKPKKKETEKTAKGLENFMDTDDWKLR